MFLTAKYFRNGLVLVFSGVIFLEICAYLSHSVADYFFSLSAAALFSITLLRPYFGIVLFAAFVPFWNGAFLLNGHGDTSQLFSVVFLGWAIRFLLKGKDKTNANPSPLGVLACLLITLLFFNLAIILVRVSPWPPTSRLWLEWLSAFHFARQSDPLWQINAALVFLKGLFFFLMICEEIRDHSRWHIFSRLVYVQAAGIVFFSLWQYFNYWVKDIPHLGISLPFNDIHSFGSAVVLIFVIQVLLFLDRIKRKPFGFLAFASFKDKIQISFYFILVLTLLLLCVLASSRITWLVASFMLIILSVREFRSWKRLVLVGIILTFTIALGNQLESKFKGAEDPTLNRLGSLFDLENIHSDEALTVRYELWKRALKMVGEYPASGVGIGNFYRNSQSLPFKTSSAGLWDRENAHNYYLQIAAELGLPGIAIFSFILLLLLLPIRSFMMQNHLIDNDSVICLSPFRYGLFAYLLTMLTGHPLLLSSQQFLFWFVAGVIASGASMQRNIPFNFSLLEKALVAASGIALVFYVLGMAVNTVRSEPWTINRTYGFYSEEDWDGTAMRWTSAKASCRLRLRLQKEKVYFKIVALPFNSTPPQGLNLRIAVNGKTVENLHFVDGGSRIVSLSGNEEEMQVTFEVDRVFRPKEIGLSDDTRLLGVAVGRLEALPFQPAIQLMLLRN